MIVRVGLRPEVVLEVVLEVVFGSNKMPGALLHTST